MHLTDHTFKRLGVPEKGRVTYSDDSIPGFGVRVSASGVKSFVLLLGRSRKRVTIGRFPLVTLAQARSRAREIIAQRLLGKDDVPPMQFEEALPVFIASRYGEKYEKPRTRDETERLLRRHFLPKFRYEQLSTIRAHEIADIVDKLRKTPSIAHHAFGAIRLFFHWAEGRGYVLRSPCATLTPLPIGKPRERVLDRDELKALLSALRTKDDTFSTIVELLLYTGQRRGEIAGLRAEWIDWENQTIAFPRSITKNKRKHTIPFGTRVGELLERGERKGLLFPALGTEGKRPFAGWSKSKPRLDNRCPLPAWTLHDLRRTCATNLAALGVSIPVTERLLNHVSGTSGGLVAVYQRYDYRAELQEAVSLWSSYLDDLAREPASAGERVEDAPALRIVA